MATEQTRLAPDFRRFLFAAAASNLGDGIRLGALPLLALSLTDDARLIALVSASTMLPWLLLGPLGGAIVDRHDRRRLMIGGQVARAALVTALIAMIATDTATIGWVVVVAFGLGTGEIIVDSSSQAAVPQLVGPEQLDRANGQLIAAITVLDEVVGVALGAVLFSVASGLPFVVDVATFLVGALLLTTVRRPLQRTRSATTSVRTDMAEGMRFLFRHPLLRGMMAAVSITNLAANTSFGVMVILVVDELGANETTFGLVLGVGALGGVIGSLVASRIVGRIGRRPTLLATPAVLAATYLINAVSTSPWMVSASFFIASLSVVCFNVPGQSIRQTVTPEHLLGRVVASFRMFAVGAGPIGAILGGLITQAASVRAANVVAAGIQVIAFVVLVAALRHLSPALATAGRSTPPPGRI